MSLNLVNVSYSYDRVPPPVRALDSVDLDVGVGELVLVLGTTGSGKSTLLLVASGLVEPEHGEAIIDGATLGREHVGSSVGLVFQDAESQLFADSVMDDVAFGPLNLGVDPTEASGRAHEALSTVGLQPDEFGDRSPFSLSGGEARRAAIAGVLAMGPRYLLADEPTAGLDASGRKAVREALLRARRSAGVVVVSHSSDDFLPHADKVLLLTGGRTSWWGPASALVAEPSPLVRAGLRLPPVLSVQAELHRRGRYDQPFTLDPTEAAHRISQVMRCSP